MRSGWFFFCVFFLLFRRTACLARRTERRSTTRQDATSRPTTGHGLRFHLDHSQSERHLHSKLLKVLCTRFSKNATPHPSPSRPTRSHPLAVHQVIFFEDSASFLHSYANLRNRSKMANISKKFNMTQASRIMAEVIEKVRRPRTKSEWEEDRRA